MKKDEGSLMRELCAGGEDREWMSARLQHGIGKGFYGMRGQTAPTHERGIAWLATSRIKG